MANEEMLLSISAHGRLHWCTSPWDGIIDDALAQIECSKTATAVERPPGEWTSAEWISGTIPSSWEPNHQTNPSNITPGNPEDWRNQDSHNDCKEPAESTSSSIHNSREPSHYSNPGEHQDDDQDHGDLNNHSDGSQDTAHGASFHLFPLFPAEIRERIWLATVDPVVLPLVVISNEVPGDPGPGELRFTVDIAWSAVRKHSDVPIYQPINREARSLALKHFGRPTRHALPFSPTYDTAEVAACTCHMTSSVEPDELWNLATRPANIDCQDATCDCSTSMYGLDGALLVIQTIGVSGSVFHGRVFHRATPDLMSRIRNLRVTFYGNIPRRIEAAYLYQSKLASLIAAAFPSLQEMRLVVPRLDDSALIGRVGYCQESHRAYDWTRWCFLDALRNLSTDQGRGRQVPFPSLRRIVMELHESFALGRSCPSSAALCWQYAAFDKDGRSTEPLSEGNSMMYCEKGDERSIDRMMVEDGATGGVIYAGSLWRR